MPIDYLADDMIQRWQVDVHGMQDFVELSIVRTPEEVQGLVRCSIESEGIFDSLAACGYRLRFNLHRSGSRRAEATAEFLYWKGLQGYAERGFQLADRPSNLIPAECRGFALQPNAITHQPDNRRQHTLTFDVAGSATALEWS